MLYLHIHDHLDRWLKAFRQEFSNQTVVTADSHADPADVRWLAAWAPPKGLFKKFPNLEAVFALGAGVDGFLDRPDLSPDTPLIRLVDAGMGRQMAEYALFSVLWFQRDMDIYAAQKSRQIWEPMLARSAEDMKIGVLGLGALGMQVARTLSDLGYPVSGWRRSPEPVEGIRTYSGEEGLTALLKESDVLVSLLPNTPETQGLLNRETLSRLPEGASIVNVGRGSLIVAEDMIAQLDTGHLRGAVLDVFATEPLPENDPLWTHPKVFITPHAAAETLPEPATRQVADDLRRLLKGEKPIGLVSLKKGY